MHHGLIAHRHGVDQLVEAVAKLRARIPGIQLDIYGSHTAFLDKVLEHGTSGPARRYRALSRHEVPRRRSRRPSSTAMSAAVPNRRSMFTELNFPTRLFEYLAMRRQVIAPSTKGIRDYFTGAPDRLFRAGQCRVLLAARLL